MPHYDLSELRTMSQGNEGFVKKMINVFLETTVESLDELVEHFNKGEFSDVSSIAHKIKPSIDLMGVSELKDVVRAIEKNGKEGGEELGTLVPKLEEVLRMVFEEMKGEIQ